MVPYGLEGSHRPSRITREVRLRGVGWLGGLDPKVQEGMKDEGWLRMIDARGEPSRNINQT